MSVSDPSVLPYMCGIVLNLFNSRQWSDVGIGSYGAYVYGVCGMLTDIVVICVHDREQASVNGKESAVRMFCGTRYIPSDHGDHDHFLVEIERIIVHHLDT